MAGVVPPWGIEGGGTAQQQRGRPQRGNENFDPRRDPRSVPGRGGAAGEVVSSALELRQASILSERNILLDELIQVKKELQLAQMESKRMADAFVQRLSVVESRIMAGEANTRTLDKREAGGQQALAAQRGDIELKMREMLAEMARFKQGLESEFRGQMQTIQAELKQRDTAMLQVEAQAREWVRHSRAADEQRARMETELKASVEKRLLVVQDATRKMEADHLDRVAVLERLMQREADERVQGDEQTRKDLEDGINVLRKASEREELAIERLQADLRSELDGVVQATSARVTAFREEAERGRARLDDDLQEERARRVDDSEDIKRKLDTFIKLYEVERARLRDAVRSALEQMTERTRSVQEVSRAMQQEGVRIKNSAARVEQEAMDGLAQLTEKVEDGFHVLRAVQDRHALQIQENRQQGAAGLQDLRDKVQQAQARVQAELDKNFQEDRQTRQDMTKRLDDMDEAGQKAERRLTHAHHEVEDKVRRTLETVNKDMETLRFRTMTALTDVEGQAYDVKQRVHAVEVQTEQRMVGHGDDLRAAHSKMWEEILHLKSNMRGAAAVDQELRVATNLNLQKLAAVVKKLGGSLLAWDAQHGAQVAHRAPDLQATELGKETDELEASLVRDAERIANMQARGQAMQLEADRHVEQELARLRLSQQEAGAKLTHEASEAEVAQLKAQLSKTVAERDEMKMSLDLSKVVGHGPGGDEVAVRDAGFGQGGVQAEDDGGQGKAADAAGLVAATAGSSDGGLEGQGEPSGDKDAVGSVGSGGSEAQEERKLGTGEKKFVDDFVDDIMLGGQAPAGLPEEAAGGDPSQSDAGSGAAPKESDDLIAPAAPAGGAQSSTGMSAERLRQVEAWGSAVFRRFDVNQDGQLSKYELVAMLRTLPSPAAQSADEQGSAGRAGSKVDAVAELIARMDADGDALISEAEWLVSLAECEGLASVLEGVEAAGTTVKVEEMAAAADMSDAFTDEHRAAALKIQARQRGRRDRAAVEQLRSAQELLKPLNVAPALRGAGGDGEDGAGGADDAGAHDLDSTIQKLEADKAALAARLQEVSEGAQGASGDDVQVPSSSPQAARDVQQDGHRDALAELQDDAEGASVAAEVDARPGDSAQTLAPLASEAELAGTGENAPDAADLGGQDSAHDVGKGGAELSGADASGQGDEVVGVDEDDATDEGAAAVASGIEDADVEGGAVDDTVADAADDTVDSARPGTPPAAAQGLAAEASRNGAAEEVGSESAGAQDGERPTEALDAAGGQEGETVAVESLSDGASNGPAGTVLRCV